MTTGWAFGQALSPAPAISFHFERAGLAVPGYTFTIGDDGSGTYLAPPPLPPASARSPYALPAATGEGDASAGAPFAHPLALAPKTVATLFALLRGTGGLRDGLCASKAKNIADTGRKTLSLRGSDGAETRCTFNFSESKPVVEVTAIFQAMAVTLEAGDRLAFLQRFDRLGLDAEMGALSTAFKEGRAAEPGNIARVLRSLVDDPEVLERVRTQAARLLALAAADGAFPGPQR